MPILFIFVSLAFVTSTVIERPVDRPRSPSICARRQSAPDRTFQSMLPGVTRYAENTRKGHPPPSNRRALRPHASQAALRHEPPHEAKVLATCVKAAEKVDRNPMLLDVLHRNFERWESRERIATGRSIRIWRKVLA